MDLTMCEARPRRGGHTRPGDVRRAAPRRRAAAHRPGAEQRARRGASLVLVADDRGTELRGLKRYSRGKRRQAKPVSEERREPDKKGDGSTL